MLYNDDTTVKILAMMDRQALTEDLVDEPVEDSTEDGSGGEDSAEMAGDAAGKRNVSLPDTRLRVAVGDREARSPAQRHVHHGHRRGDRRRRAEDRSCSSA